MPDPKQPPSEALDPVTFALAISMASLSDSRDEFMELKGPIYERIIDGAAELRRELCRRGYVLESIVDVTKAIFWLRHDSDNPNSTGETSRLRREAATGLSSTVIVEPDA